MPVLPKPATKMDWTVGNPNFGTVTIEPTSGKKITGWTPGERPPSQYMNWLFYNTDQWVDYFESITDDHETRIDVIEAALPGLGTAAGISASNAGHTYLTGATVQLQLDETDTFLEDIVNSITQGKGADLVGYIEAVPSDWDAVPGQVGDALDELAARVRVLENLTNIGDFIDDAFNDYCIPADSPLGNGNAGYTDSLSTNPMQLKFSDNAVLFGEERLEFIMIKPTGKYDSAGKREWAVWTQKGFEPRVRLYGSGWSLGEGVSGAFPYTATSGDYFITTGIMDGFAILSGSGSGSPNNVDVLKNNVDTGVNLDFRNAGVIGNKGTRELSVYSDATMQNLTRDLMTWKVVNGATDSSLSFYLQGVVFINTVPLDVGGKMFLQKNIVTLAKQNITPVSVGVKGGVVYRYVDRADNLRKEVAAEPELVETTSASIGAASTSISVASVAGFVAGDIILIKDSVSAELARISSVGVSTITIPAPGTAFGYTSATVRLYARTFASGALSHSNEKVKNLKNYKAFSDVNAGPNQDSGLVAAGSLINVRTDHVMPDGCTRLASSASNSAQFNTVPGIYWNTNDEDLVYEWVGTGLDVLVDYLGSITGTVKVLIDNVDMGNLTLGVVNETLWKTIVSDLPWGWHSVVFRGSAAGSLPIAWNSFKEYEPKTPTVIAALPKGDLLAKRAVPGEFNFIDPQGAVQGGYFVQPGTIRQNLLTGSVFKEGTGGTNDWAIGVEGATTRFSWNPGIIFSTNRTNANYTRWFFGKGVTIAGRVNTDQGIAQIKIDGNNATTVNFPGATFKSSSGGGSFAPSTGLWDQYHTTALEGALVSIDGLTEGWHKLEVVCTGTKNGSSSDFFIYLNQVQVHGMTFWGDVAQQSFTHPMGSVNYGGVRDARRMDPLLPNADEVEYLKTVAERSGAGSLSFGFGSASFPLGRAVMPFKTKGGLFELNFSEEWRQTVETGGANWVVYLDNQLIWTIALSADRPSYLEDIALSGIMFQVPEGEHLLWIEKYTGGSGTLTSFQRIMTLKPCYERKLA